MTNPKRQFPANAGRFFFSRDEFDYAVGVVAQRLEEGATVDFSWLPQLVAIGGFQYERGRREFAEWSDSMQAIADAYRDRLNLPPGLPKPACLPLVRDS